MYAVFTGSWAKATAVAGYFGVSSAILEDYGGVQNVRVLCHARLRVEFPGHEGIGDAVSTTKAA